MISQIPIYKYTFVPRQLVGVLCSDGMYWDARIVDFLPDHKSVRIKTSWDGKIITVPLALLKARRGRRPSLKVRKAQAQSQPVPGQDMIAQLCAQVDAQAAEIGYLKEARAKDEARVGIVEETLSRTIERSDRQGRLLAQLRDEVRRLMGLPTPYAAAK